jgi:hypothetical protein
MLQIGRQIYSFELFDEQFVCDLEKCLGACCVIGESGAPLEEEEAALLDEIYPLLEPFLREEAYSYLEKKGRHTIDQENDLVTPLLDGKECVYTVFENSIAKCGIEKAFHQGAIPFRKPLSCHLYPIRIRSYSQFDAVNYHRWPICQPATTLGKSLKVPVYRFCKDAIIRKYGQEEYSELQAAYRQYMESTKD